MPPGRSDRIRRKEMGPETRVGIEVRERMYREAGGRRNLSARKKYKRGGVSGGAGKAAAELPSQKKEPG
jgi:hypothetical protein